MKHLLILVFCIFFTIEGFAQQPEQSDSGFVNKTEAQNKKINGLKEGKWLEYVKLLQDIKDKTDITNDTNLAGCYRLIFYKAGKPYGIVREYYMNGKLLGLIPYTKGRKNGLEKWYYANGVLKSQMPYTNGVENGIRKTYYESGGIESETPFTNGKLNGSDKEFYENGNLKYEYPYTFNNKNGTGKEYYESGKLETEYPFLNDTINGMCNTYYENGQLMSITRYIRGKEGTTKYYCSNGNEIVLERNSYDSLTFSWTDTTFQVYAKRIINLRYDLDGPCTVEPCYNTWDNNLSYDTLISFLKAHPFIQIEIAAHINSLLNGHKTSGEPFDYRHSQAEADYVKRVLVDKGINKDRIIAIGYGNRVPDFSEREKENSKKGQKIRRMKRIIEIIIIANGKEIK